MIDLKDKRILITGVSSAIGSAIAEEILKGNGSVVGTCRNENAITLENLKKHPSFKLVNWSVSDPCDFIEKINHIDGWVHCIGTINPQPIKYLKQSGNEDLFDVNYFSATHLASKLLKQNGINKNASLVFISSVSSHHPYRGGATYVASKAALESFAKALALEVSHMKIRVNTISCALVNTPIYQASAAMYSEAERKAVEAKYPLGIGEPVDVASACVFLLSDAARWITGSNLRMDGGLMLNV